MNQLPPDNPFGEVISRYTRAQAIEDGVLVDVTELAAEAGFKFPTAISAGVKAVIDDVPGGSGQDTKGRLWDVLHLASFAVRRVPQGEDRAFYDVTISTPGNRQNVEHLVVHIGPGDTAEPVLTICHPIDL